jgi:PTS system galactitol-specific IIA component
MSSKNIYLAAEGHADNWEEAIRLCGKTLIDHGSVQQDFVEACVEREKEYPTGLPTKIPVAIPHSKAQGIKDNAICFLRLDRAVRFFRMDDADEYCDTKLIFNLAIKGADDHLEFLQKLMQFVMNDGVLEECEKMQLADIPAFIESKLG